MVFNKLSMALAAALFLSLSVNFFLAGLMLGNAVSTKPAVVDDGKAEMSPEEARRAEWQKRDEALRAALSPADREVVQSHTEVNKQKFEELKARMDDARQGVAVAMTADPFDQAALDAAIEAETEVKTMFMREMYRARRAVTEELSPEGRKIFQEMNPLRRRGSHRPPPEPGADSNNREDSRPMRPRSMEERAGEEGRDRMMERRARIERMQQMRNASPPPGSTRPEDKSSPPATGMGGVKSPPAMEPPPPSSSP